MRRDRVMVDLPRCGNKMSGVSATQVPWMCDRLCMRVLGCRRSWVYSITVSGIAKTVARIHGWAL
jgi:hypothetical protein